MLKRLISFVFIVLMFWTIPALSAAKKKPTVVATSKVVYVCNQKKALTIKKPQRAVIIDCTKKKTKIAKVPSKPKKVAAAKAVKEKVAQVKKKPPKMQKVAVVSKPEHSRMSITWLTRLLLVEAGLEDEKSRMAVLWIPVRYAKVNKRSLYDEIVTSRRYSGINCKECLQVAIATTGEDWSIAQAQAITMLENPVPPDPRLKYATTYVRWEHASENGADWIRKYTCPLDPEAKSDLQIGKHIFREECVQQRLRGVVIPWPPKPNPNLIAQKAFKKLASNK